MNMIDFFLFFISVSMWYFKLSTCRAKGVVAQLSVSPHHSAHGGNHGQPWLSAIIQARRLSLFGHIAHIQDETDAKKILWRTTGDYRDALILRG